MPDTPRMQFEEDFFVYNVLFDAIAPGDTQQANIAIQADSHFKWIKATMQADIDAAAYTSGARPLPLAALQLVDSGSGRQLFLSALPLELVFGTGELPFILPIPRIFRARSNIALTLTNFDAAVTYDIRLALIGTKMFAKGGSPLL
jgi:hypothetical protein